jgi:hypothetical protein
MRPSNPDPILTRQRRVEILEGAIKMMNERFISHSKEELEKGRSPDESIVIQTNRLYVMLLDGWLQAEKELLEFEKAGRHGIEARVRHRKKKHD